MLLVPAFLSLVASSSATFIFPASDALPNPPAATQVGFASNLGSVDLDGSGTLAVVGAAGNADKYLGVATVFARDGAGAWANCSTLGGAGVVAAGSSFGKSLALSADATTLLVGAPGRSPYEGNGTAWVYASSGGGGCSSWSLAQVLLPDDGAVIGAAFGLTVALSADGSVALVSAPNEASNAGAVYLFTRTVAGGRFSQTGKWLGANEGDRFGKLAIALSASGTVALIGAQGVAKFTGAATLMTTTAVGAAWTSTPLVPVVPSSAGDSFGYSVALSADGTAALVGAPNAGATAGYAYAFAASGGGNWSQIGGTLLATDVPWATAQCTPSAFGTTVKLAGGAAFAVVGAPATTCGDATAVGAAYLFAAPDSAAASWRGVANLMPPEARAGASVGRAIAASSSASSAAAALVCIVQDSSSGTAPQCFAARVAAIPPDVGPTAGLGAAQLAGIAAGAIALAAAAAAGVLLWRRKQSRSSVPADAQKSAATGYAHTRSRSSAAERVLDDDDEDGALSASEAAAIGAEAARAIGREPTAAASTAVAGTIGSGNVLRAARVAALRNPVAVAGNSQKLSPP